VIGINTAIIAMAQNLGFAIPVNTARWVLTQLLTRGRVLRGYLGIAGRERPLDRRLVRHLQLEVERGVEIAGAEKDQPADKAGLRNGDIIIALAGRPVRDIPDLQRVLGEIPVGVVAEIEVLRRTQRLKVEVTPTEAPA
jgi:S1-C subfamily serine protease